MINRPWRYAWTMLFFVLGMKLAVSALAQEAHAASSTTTDEQVANQEFQRQLKEAENLIINQQFSKAEALLRELTRSHPGVVDAEFMLANALIEKSSYPEAMAIFDRLMEEHPDNATLLNNYAWLLATATDVSVRDPKRALVMARDALFMAPNDYRVWSTLAEAHYANGNFEKAAQSIEKGLEQAILQNAPEENVLRYRVQLRKLQDVRSSMSLIE